MLILTRTEIQNLVDWDRAVAALKDGFAAFSAGRVATAPVGYIGFPDQRGDCHIKSGHVAGDPFFVIKVSTGFYGNAAKGLPSSNGLSVVLSALTGAPVALLQDEGWLTDLRTGLAGAIATQALCRPDAIDVGIVGTGTQARLQLQCLGHLLKGRRLRIRVWGRSATAVDLYRSDMARAGFEVSGTRSLEELCGSSDILVTTTPSPSPLIRSAWVRPGTHITAVGADAPGKQELEPALLTRAKAVLVDSRDQCADHGEIAEAVRTGLIDPSDCMEIGELFGGRANPAREGDITVADLTGLAVQDIAIAKVVLESHRALHA